MRVQKKRWMQDLRNEGTVERGILQGEEGFIFKGEINKKIDII